MPTDIVLSNENLGFINGIDLYLKFFM